MAKDNMDIHIFKAFYSHHLIWIYAQLIAKSKSQNFNAIYIYYDINNAVSLLYIQYGKGVMQPSQQQMKYKQGKFEENIGLKKATSSTERGVKL